MKPSALPPLPPETVVSLPLSKRLTPKAGWKHLRLIEPGHAGGVAEGRRRIVSRRRPPGRRGAEIGRRHLVKEQAAGVRTGRRDGRCKHPGDDDAISLLDVPNLSHRSLPLIEKSTDLVGIPPCSVAAAMPPASAGRVVDVVDVQACAGLVRILREIRNHARYPGSTNCSSARSPRRSVATRRRSPPNAYLFGLSTVSRRRGQSPASAEFGGNNSGTSNGS